MKAISPTRATTLVLAIFVVGATAGGLAGRAAVARAQDPYASLDLFAEVLTVVETDYVDEVSTADLVDAAIVGMTDELDPHSRWLSAEQARDFQDETDGAYEGIGVEVRWDERGVRVTRVLPGSPAERDGVQAEDVIVEVDGEALAGLDLDQVAQRLQGPRGEPLTLTVARGEQRLSIATVRDRVHVEAVEAALLEGGVVYAHLAQFTDGCGPELSDKIERLGEEAGGLEGLVLDLRDNPGGLLDEAVAVTDLFLDVGPIVSTRGRLDGSTEHVATRGGVDPDVPVVVLVNGRSASASEIVASALQDTGRASLVGTRTYGKGSVQTLYRHEDGSALKLTVGRYYTPSGEPVATREGREPDHLVPLPGSPTAREQLRERLEALEVEEAARAELLELVDEIPPEEAPEADVPWHVAPDQRAEVDPQLAAALELIRS